VFVRDLRRDRTLLVSTGDGANRGLGPTRGSSVASDAFALFPCSPGLD
jgi:hypothetical protein